MFDTLKDYKNLIQLNFSTDLKKINNILDNVNVFTLSSSVFLIKSEFIHNVIIDRFCDKLKKETISNDISNVFKIANYSTIINMLNGNSISENTLHKIINSDILFERLKETKTFNSVFVDLLYSIKENKNFDKIDYNSIEKIFNRDNLELIIDNAKELNHKQNIFFDKKNIESLIDFYNNIKDYKDSKIDLNDR